MGFFAKKNIGQLSENISKPRPIIWDTDWWTDVDDVVAARILLWAERAGMIDIVGVAISADNYNVVPSLDAFFEAEGRPNMTIAIDHDATDYGGTLTYQVNMMQYRRNYSSSASAESAVTFYRRALANTTQKIDIIAVGYPNNLSNLLQSTADEISPLTGIELVTQKVNHLWMMAGEYPSGTENNFSRNVRSRTAGAYVCENWTTPITFAGWSVGSTVITGATLATVSPKEDDLLTQALYDHGSSTGRSSWDPMLTLMACYGDIAMAGYRSEAGTVSVNTSTGANTFTYDKNGKHRYVIKVRTDNWYKYNINNIIEKRSWLSRNNIGSEQLSKPNRLLNVVDAENLIGFWSASDLVGCPDSSSQYHLEDRSGNGNHFMANISERPTFLGSKSGKPALQFDGTKRMFTDIVDMPTSMTVYCRVLWSTLPSSNQTIMAQDKSDGSLRLWHIKGSNSTTVQGAAFNGGTGTVDSKTNTLVVDQWHTIAMRITGTTIETFFDGVSDGSTSFASHNIGSIPIALGNRYSNSSFSEAFVGFIHEARIYNGTHNNTTISAVISQMG